MPRILLLLLLVAALLLLFYRFRGLTSARKKQVLKYLLILLVVAVFAGLAITGRLSWLFALVASVIPLIPRIIAWLVRILPSLQPLLKYFKISRKADNQPQMETRYLRVTLNEKTRDMEGVVVRGVFRGRLLQSLSIDELLRLLDECSHSDVESVALLMAFMDRYHHGWRKQQGAQGNGHASTGNMTRQEAREILQVSESATEKEIIEAHRRLIQKLHPDRGGSDYLAAKINQAKETLLV
ncbi:MAG: DnaJ domain-containing protein [Gammaproteobacteria bacterium]|nr:DnaJ domain-containing protein [Gammaproteobacteria bacterium]